MRKYKVLFLDLDGTVVRPDNTIEESTKYAISEIQKKGLEVFLATGRPIHEIRHIAKELNVNSFIGYNGAYGVYKGTDLFKEYMDTNMVMDFLQIAKKYNHELVLYTHNLNTFTSLETPGVDQIIEGLHLTNNALYSPLEHENILGITVINVKGAEYVHYQSISGVHLSQINVEGMHHCYDAIQEKINKGMGVKLALNHLEISKESAIAFGDGMNDKEMLLNVGESIAMGNAHPALFTYAKHKTTNVTDSGISNGLKMLGVIS